MENIRKKLHRKLVRTYGDRNLRDAIIKRGEFLGFKGLTGSVDRKDTIAVWFNEDGYIGTLDAGHEKERQYISINSFFELEPDPVKRTITLELTEEQEALVRAALGEQV